MGNLGVGEGAQGSSATPDAELGVAAARAEVERVDAVLVEAEDAVRRWVETYRDFAAGNGAVS